MRFSGDTSPGRPDLKGTAGIGIKLFGVAGAKLLARPGRDDPGLPPQNYDVFFVDTAKDMCEFT